MRSATGHHSSLADSQAAVRHQVSGGAPLAKIVLGIPAYARHADNPSQVKSYAEIIDAAEAVPVAHKPLELAPSERTPDNFLGNGPKLVSEKVWWAFDGGLAGVFFWEMGQDKIAHPHSLIAAAAASASSFEATTGGFPTKNEL